MVSSGFETVLDLVGDLADSTADRAVSRVVEELTARAPELVVDVLDALTTIS